jgi:proliferating cell nuclear antigen
MTDLTLRGMLNISHCSQIIDTFGFHCQNEVPDEWKAVTSAISTLVMRLRLKQLQRSLLQGMDPSHVALIDIGWPNSAFDAYESDSALKFGVRIDEFSKLIKRATKDLVEISIGMIACCM